MKRSLINVSILLISFSLVACSSTRKESAGIRDGKLLPCPSSPNCISSQAEDPDHKTEAISFPASEKATIHKIVVDTLHSMERASIVTNSPDYIHAVFKTKLFKFKDDVDLLFDYEAGRIQIRSASRTGYSDFGVNRKRVEAIRQQIQEAIK